ncbi:hypothetical protein ACRS8P_02680 [Burkholderia cenocepacia]
MEKNNRSLFIKRCRIVASIGADGSGGVGKHQCWVGAINLVSGPKLPSASGCEPFQEIGGDFASSRFALQTPCELST